MSERGTLKRPDWFTPELEARRTRKRYRAERRFKLYGLVAIGIGLAFLALLFYKIGSTAYPAFTEIALEIEVSYDKDLVSPDGATDPDTLRNGDYATVVQNALKSYIQVPDDDADGQRLLGALLSSDSDARVRAALLQDPGLIGKKHKVWVLASGDVDSYLKGLFDPGVREADRRVKDRQVAWLQKFRADGRLETRFAWTLFFATSSAEPQTAGLGVALLGSLYMMLLIFALCVPLGVATAVYLEEFAPKNRWTDLIEVNINNLAAVPSIVFGILGLAVFLNFFDLPRSSALVGGLVLTLLALPTVIIATRAAFKAVPPSIRQAALGIGASQMQMIGHHVLPLAVPGIMTGTIIALAHAIGETAPLLMIGMVAQVFNYPATPLDPSTALPVQIYMWAGEQERGFVPRTSAAIIVLLAFLITMNAVAIYLRKKFERRW